MSDKKKLQKEINARCDELQILGETAEAAKRDLTTTEQQRSEVLVAELESLRGQVHVIDVANAKDFRPSFANSSNPAALGGLVQSAVGRGGVRALALGESFSHVGVTAPVNGFGEFARGATFGADDYTPSAVIEALNVQTTSPDSAGGVMVPAPIADQIIDNARAMSVVDKMAPQYYQMTSESLTIPTVVTDPTFSSVAEAAAIPITDVVFGEKALIPRKYAAIINASNELVGSGMSFAQRLQAVMTRTLAAVIDDALLNGDGIAPNVEGIFTVAGIPSTDAGAVPLDWAIVDAAAAAVCQANYEPMFLICSPSNAHALANVLASTSGVYLGPPATSANLRILSSSSVGNDVAMVGTDGMFGVGVREQMRLETSREYSEAWSKDLTSFRLITRFDGVVLDNAAFHKITNIG